MYNPVILVALFVQVIVARFSRKAGALIGFVITTFILLWGLGTYGNGDTIALFGIPLSMPIFLLVCLFWYGYDFKAMIEAGDGTLKVTEKYNND